MLYPPERVLMAGTALATLPQPVYQRNRVPVEFIGLARQLLRTLTTLQSDSDDRTNTLLAPLRPRQGFTPIPSQQYLRRIELGWKTLPQVARLSTIAKLENGRLQCAELRCLPSEIKLHDWTEPAVSVVLNLLTMRPVMREFSEVRIILAMVGLHALARRFQRHA